MTSRGVSQLAWAKLQTHYFVCREIVKLRRFFEILSWLNKTEQFYTYCCFSANTTNNDRFRVNNWTKLSVLTHQVTVAKKQNSRQPVTRIIYGKRNVTICHKAECIVFTQALAPSSQTIQKIIWFYWKGRSSNFWNSPNNFNHCSYGYRHYNE